MKARIALVAVIATLSAQTTRTVWDGAYTKEQADRGKAAYADRCQRCHGGDLSGGDETPALTGDAFLANWNTLSVNDLFERVRVSMPADKPGTLSRQANSDILAYIFSANKFPAGSAELATQAEILKQVQILATKP